MRTVFAAALLCLLHAIPARANFEDAGFGARDTAMGGAFTAVSDDPAVLSYNPAALGQQQATEASVSYLRQFHIPAGETDRDMVRTGVAIPIRQEILNGGIGVDLRYDRRLGIGGDRAFGVMYGTRGLKETENGGLDFGGGLRLHSASFDDGGPSGTLKPALDFGVLYRFGSRYSAGASLLNFFSPRFSSGGKKDRAPLSLRVGVAEQIKGLTLALDLVKRESSMGVDGAHTVSAGFEKWFGMFRLGQGALRSGLTLGDGAHYYAWGLGWRVSSARLDYSMTVPISGKTRFGHGVTLTMRFGSAEPEAEYERLLARELQSRRRLTEALEAGGIKQWKLAEELSRLREEMAQLKLEVEHKRASEADAKRRFQELERRRREASEEYDRLRFDRDGAAKTAREALFREDWRLYQKAKLSGAADSALQDHAGRILREYKDSGVDLSEASRELQRLQRAR